MEMLATSNGPMRDYASGKVVLSFRAEEFIEGGADLPSGLLRVVVKPYKQKRSLNANAYYWQLIGKLAKSMLISNDHAHNLMLRAYGEPEVIGGCLVPVVLPDMEEVEADVLESRNFHLKPTSSVKDGKRLYYKIKGSSLYDTGEMSRLIDGTVQECRDIGIEVLSPEEIERMMAAYEKHCPHES